MYIVYHVKIHIKNISLCTDGEIWEDWLLLMVEYRYVSKLMFTHKQLLPVHKHIYIYLGKMFTQLDSVPFKEQKCFASFPDWSFEDKLRRLLGSH